MLPFGYKYKSKPSVDKKVSLFFSAQFPAVANISLAMPMINHFICGKGDDESF